MTLFVHRSGVWVLCFAEGRIMRQVYLENEDLRDYNYAVTARQNSGYCAMPQKNGKEKTGCVNEKEKSFLEQPI